MITECLHDPCWYQHRNRYREILRWCISLALFLFGPASAADYLARVDYVIDGDTVILVNGDKIRLIGINAPEKEYRDQPADPYALEARLMLDELVVGREVMVIPGQEPRDQYGRLLAEIKLPDGTDVQLELLHRGYAAAIAVPPNIRRLDRYLAAEADARRDQRGIWSDSSFVVDLDSPIVLSRQGFVVVKGRVTGFYSSKNNYYYALGNKLTVQVPRLKWEKFWQSWITEEVMGQKYEIRGWVKMRNEKYYMLVSHPSMMKLIQ
jgi:endonuclease YncB( thermonuclease family)